MKTLLSIIMLTTSILGATWNTDSDPTPAEVQALVNGASAGDTISIAAGAFSWGSGVTIGDRINIKGQGGRNGTTKITVTVGGFDVFHFTGFTATETLTISGIEFNLLDDTSNTSAVETSSCTLDQLIITDCEFHYGSSQLLLAGAKGVVYECNSYNPIKFISYTAGTTAQANESWDDLTAGTNDALFIEDNNIYWNSDYNESYSQETIGTFNGGKLVIRYNAWDGTGYPNSTTVDPIMTHGSAGAGVTDGYWQIGTGARRGQSVVEIYNNTVTATRVDTLCILRGSTNLVYNNTLDTATHNPVILLREEEQDGGQWNPARTAWPAEDQVHNSFFWNNVLRLNGTPNSNYVSVQSGSETYIQEDRDYWMNEPASSGGSESFTGKNGGSSAYPTDGVRHPTLGNMTFSSSGANAHYPYTPYNYPHPLRTQAGSTYTGQIKLDGSGAKPSTSNGAKFDLN